MNDEIDNSKCLMWPASFPGSDAIEDAHCTVLYMGDDVDLELDPTLVLSALYPYLDAPGVVEVTGVEIFGEDEKVWVATLATNRLDPLRSDIKEVVHSQLNVSDASSFPTYRPHVTLGPVTDEDNPPAAPTEVTLGSLELWLGYEHYYSAAHKDFTL